MYNNIFEFYIDGEVYSVRLSDHAIERMDERDISVEHIIDNINELSLPQCRYLRNNSYKAIIINQETNVSIVIGFNKEHYKVTVITVIREEIPFATEGTVIINI